MMSASVRLGDGTAIVFESVNATHTHPERRVLLTLEGKVPGDILNCALIPIDKVPAVIASLQLAASQAKLR